MSSNADMFQKEVDRWFLSATKLGWDDVDIRRKIEDQIRKARYNNPTLYRRVLYTIAKILKIKLERKDKKLSKHKAE